MALEAALAGARAGVWVADEQTAGRGRGGPSVALGRGGWAVCESALVTPQVPLNEAPWIALATGLAVQSAVAEVAGLEMDLRWPNDLMFGARKAGGILVESVSEARPGGGAGLRYAVVGIGVNVGQAEFPEELREVATSLYLESGRLSSREELLGAMLRGLEVELRTMEDGSPGLLERFSAASSWVRGKQVRVAEQGGYTGWTCGLDARGFLKVKDTGGQRANGAVRRGSAFLGVWEDDAVCDGRGELQYGAGAFFGRLERDRRLSRGRLDFRRNW